MNLIQFNLKIIFTITLLCCAATLFAQVSSPVEKKKPVAVSSVRQPDAATDIREKLLQLALQNPAYEIVDRKVAIAMYLVRKAKGNWLSTVILQGNLNEFAFKGSTTGPGGVISNPSSYYPKYNFGIGIPFNLISDRKNEVKIAKENLGIAEATKNQQFREIKVQVLSKYEDYLLILQKLDFQSQITQDARTAYLAAEKDFQEGAIKQEDYTKSYQTFTNEKTRQFEYQHDLNIAKIQLEAMIGMSMDDLLKK